MPNYDYRCKSCGHQFEVFQRMTDEPLKTCPECDGEISRLITGGTGLIFKGSGFYITDYKNESNGSAGSTEKKSDAGTADKSDSTSTGSTGATSPAKDD